MGAPEVGYFRGAGGIVFPFHLPLSEQQEQQVTRGELVRVNEDGSPFEAHSTMDLTTGEFRRPGVNAPKNEWVGYAVSQGSSVDDADAMTKNDLIEKYGK